MEGLELSGAVCLVRARLYDGGLAAIDGFGRKEMGIKEIGESRE